MTNFQKVKVFNRISGQPVYENKNDNFFEDEKLSTLSINLIREEFNELEVAFKEKDFTETIDALADLLYVTYGMFSKMGIDADKAFSEVHNSNMSKFDENEEDAIFSVNKYVNHKIYKSPAYKFNDDLNLFIIYDKITGKTLKSHKFKLPNFNE